MLYTSCSGSLRLLSFYNKENHSTIYSKSIRPKATSAAATRIFIEVPSIQVRPVSGSGALAVGSELMEAYGADSYIGRVAAVMLGCTETTFYTIAVYFGAAGIRRTRYTVPAALTADITGFIAAALSVRLFFGT